MINFYISIKLMSTSAKEFLQNDNQYFKHTNIIINNNNKNVSNLTCNQLVSLDLLQKTVTLLLSTTITLIHSF